jgi:hypothetical protein
MRLKTALLLATPLLGIMICVSLFLGLMATSLGAAFPPLMAIGGPLVCGSGEFGIDSQSYSLPNGQSGIRRSPYCIDDQTGEKRSVTLPLVVVDTLVYGALGFVLLMVPLIILLVILMRTTTTSKAGA